MEKIWHHTFYNKLRVAPEEHPILLTGAFCEPNRERNADRERTTQIMFETFNVPQLYMKNQAVLSLCASGRTTGCVVDCGEGGSHVASIQDGYCMPHTVTCLEVGGQDLTDYLVRILTERGHYFSTSFGREVVRQMKEKLVYVAFDFAQEQRAADGPNMHHMEKSYELPDAKVVVIGSERFRCQEPLFQPKLLGRDVAGIHECTVRAINECDMDIGLRRELFSNIVLAGGSTEAPGFVQRMTREIAAVARSNVKVEAPPDRKVSAWLGGSQFASTGAVDWITKAEYDESGPSIVHRRCLD
jgi:actin-related protein